jgi:tRNA-intron endonuclease, archaea type
MVIVKATLISGKISSNAVEAFSLFEKERFGERSGEKIVYSLVEGAYLVENKKMQIVNIKEKEIKLKELIKNFVKLDKNFLISYSVFRDLRKKGNVVKSALKFGAEFRVYEPGSKLGEDHAKWILFCLSEHNKLSLQEFSAKNRIAHSTNKKLLIAVVDDEECVSYYEARWLKI